MSLKKLVFIKTEGPTNDVDPRHDDLHLSVDMRKDKPFHCDYCGATYEACRHWEIRL